MPWVDYLGLKDPFSHEIARENSPFHIFLRGTLFAINIQSNFILILLFKKIEVRTGPMNYISEYQLNFKLIEESKTNSLNKSSLDLNNTKEIVFCSPIEPNLFSTSNYQCTWLLNYLNKNFIIIRAHVN